MKTIFKILAVVAFLALGTGAFAQSCYLTIIDNDNTSGATYDLAVQVWDYTSTPPVWLHTEIVQSFYMDKSGFPQTVTLQWQIEDDYVKLKFHIGAINKSTQRTGTGTSVNPFDSYDYYYNSPPVTVTIQ